MKPKVFGEEELFRWTQREPHDWISVKDALPENGDLVIARYEGVYLARAVTFWRDEDGTPHFGLPNESDRKGSQPATHWCTV